LDAIEALRQRLQKHLKSEDVTLVLDDFLPEEA
jgi:ribosomal protein L31E